MVGETFEYALHAMVRGAKAAAAILLEELRASLTTPKLANTGSDKGMVKETSNKLGTLAGAQHDCVVNLGIDYGASVSNAWATRVG